MKFGAALSAIVVLWAVPVYAEILSATFINPTERYNHGILGDAIEYQALRITTDNITDNKLRTKTVVRKAVYIFDLPADHVFEDTEPRLADVDGDGAPEVIVIETDIAKGASLAVYDHKGKVAETPHIGSTHRWLAPVGVADFNGDGDVDIAYIDRPHLAKTLRIVSYRNGTLVEIATASNLTNHKIGWDFIASGVRDCGQGPEMITADGDWANVMSTWMVGDKLVSKKIGPYKGPESLAAALGC